MLTSSVLGSRLAEWSKKIQSVLGAAHWLDTAQSPIVLYQLTFGLVHDLKTSVSLSTDGAIQRLRDTIQASDIILKKLAYGEAALAPMDNETLFETCVKLKSPAELEAVLTAALTRAARHDPNEAHSILSKPFPWDGLAKARALSCARHHYAFAQTRFTMELKNMPEQDGAMQTSISRLGGVAVARQLDPKPQGRDLYIESTQLAAFPPSANLGPEWSAI